MTATPSTTALPSVDTSPAVTPPPGNPRFPLVDSLRAVAAVAVLLSHAVRASAYPTVPKGVVGAVLANGVQGLTVFFVISGFLLYRPYVNARVNGSPRPSWNDYLRRRLLRIVPAYWLALTLVAVWPGLPGVFTGEWWKYYFLLSGYNTATSLGGLIVAWSLSVELSFYLLLPLYASGIDRLVRARAGRAAVMPELVVLAALSALSIVLRGIDHARGSHLAVEQSLPAFLLWFAVGMGLALVSVQIQRGTSYRSVSAVIGRPWLAWGAAVVAYAALCLLVGTGDHYSTLQWVLGYYVLGALVALGLVLPAMLDDGARAGPRRVLAAPALAWVGLVSYGIYLWHVPVIAEFYDLGITSLVPLTLLAGAGAVLVAALSYYLVERPALRFKPGLRRRGRRETSAAGSVVPGRSSSPRRPSP
jgi:peptidoglycan/LPS O-acetylase OafA/YrhL